MTRRQTWIFAVSLYTSLYLPALAQQDPNDPGIQDSVILGSVSVDSSGEYRTVYVPLYAVTDDSVSFYLMPIRWYSRGGVNPISPFQYFDPLPCWDEHYDTVITGMDYILMIGWFADIDCEDIFTHGQRLHLMNLRFLVAPDAPRQLVVIDTTYDARNGGLMFGLRDGLIQFAPAFQRGFIAIGPNVGIEGEAESIAPPTVELLQNFPNPFCGDVTFFRVRLARSQHVKLEIFNILGQSVAVLADREYQTGEHHLAWSAGYSHPSGIYFYSLSTPDTVITRKMTLLR